MRHQASALWGDGPRHVPEPCGVEQVTPHTTIWRRERALSQALTRKTLTKIDAADILVPGDFFGRSRHQN